MIDRCFNPVCKRKLLYLQDGRVVRVIRGKDENISVEHYWLCGPCYESYDFDFPGDGSVALKARTSSEHLEEVYLRDVLLPDRRISRR
jgi:hypothetical protein